MNKLYIDTADSQKTIVRIEKDGVVFEEIAERASQKAQVSLPLIEKILKKSNLKIDDIDKIYVSKGPGSFTGLRVGVSIANALSFALRKPVNDMKLGDIEKPTY